MSSVTEVGGRRQSSAFWKSVIDPTLERGPLPSGSAWRAVFAVLSLFALYGLAAGFFQGDRQLLVSALKFPLVVTASLLLCIPSLYVFAVLAGAQLTVRSFLAAVLGFAGRLGLLAVAMMPIVWLFSASTRYLFVVIWMHVILWMFALQLARKALRWKGQTRRAVVTLWLVLVFFVSLQVATVLRPVLLRPPDEPLFDGGKRFFLEHFDKVAGEKTEVASG